MESVTQQVVHVHDAAGCMESVTQRIAHVCEADGCTREGLG